MPRMPSPKSLLTGATLALAGAICGCGSTLQAGSARTLQVALSEYRLGPDSVRLSAGQLTIVAHNYGRLTHNLAVSRSGGPGGATKPIAPGQSAELTLTLTPGTYLMSSTLLSDEALGEYGTLSVTR